MAFDVRMHVWIQVTWKEIFLERILERGDCSLKSTDLKNRATGGKTEGIFDHRLLLMYACFDTGDLEEIFVEHLLEGKQE